MRINTETVLIIFVSILDTSLVIDGQGQILMRITEAELNKVANVLLSDAVGVDTEVEDITDVYNDVSYEFYDISKVDLQSNMQVQIRISGDNKMTVVVYLQSIRLNMNAKFISLSDQQVLYTGRFDSTLTNATVECRNDPGLSSPSLHGYKVIDLDSCSVDMQAFNVQGSSVQLPVNLKVILRHVVASTHSMRFSIVFKDSGISFHLFGKVIAIQTETKSIEIKDNALIVTRTIETNETKRDGLLSTNKTGDYLPSILPPEAGIEPFTITVYLDSLNALFRKYLRVMGIGVEKRSVGELLPVLSDVAELSTEGLQMNLLFPTVRRTYPDATGKMLVQYADIYLSLNNNILQLHFDIDADMLVTLNCDKNRTYSAFNFTLNLVFLVQVGYDNKFLTFKSLKLGGNMTVLNSTVGHVIDRQTDSFLMSLPYYMDDALERFSEGIKGIPLTDYIPVDVFADVDSLSFGLNSIIIGGKLSPFDPQLPVLKSSEIMWVGDLISDDKLQLRGFDRTPEHLEHDEEQNCKKVPETKPNVSSAATVILSLELLFTVFAIHQFHTHVYA